MSVSADDTALSFFKRKTAALKLNCLYLKGRELLRQGVFIKPVDPILSRSSLQCRFTQYMLHAAVYFTQCNSNWILRLRWRNSCIVFTEVGSLLKHTAFTLHMKPPGEHHGGTESCVWLAAWPQSEFPSNVKTNKSKTKKQKNKKKTECKLCWV